MTLARMRAKKSVLLALRAQGLKPQDFSAREIGVLTDYYVNQHRAKLMAEAAEAIATWPGFAQHNLRVSPNQSLRLCRCQVRNDNDWICESIDRWPNTHCSTISPAIGWL
jgi:hypothetical protein